MGEQGVGVAVVVARSVMGLVLGPAGSMEEMVVRCRLVAYWALHEMVVVARALVSEVGCLPKEVR